MRDTDDLPLWVRLEEAEIEAGNVTKQLDRALARVDDLLESGELLGELIEGIKTTRQELQVMHDAYVKITHDLGVRADRAEQAQPE
jgi:hypothetical protein